MNRKDIFGQITAKSSMLCVGLDTDIAKIPSCITGSTFEKLTSFNKAIIDATAPYCVAYKPNFAFYECYGAEGVRALEVTVDYIRTKYPEEFLIADAKRGDIGNTAKKYADAIFKAMDFDAATIAPYMGVDAVRPFLEYKDKWAIVLALTSNPSATQFQMSDCNGKPLYQAVMEEMMSIAGPDKMMFVAGATRPEMLKQIRTFCPDNFLLVPGVGAQGGSAEEVMENGANDMGGLLINSSRGVLYAGNDKNFAEKAAEVAKATARLGKKC